MDGHGYSDHGANAIKRIIAFTAQTHCAVVTILASVKEAVHVPHRGRCTLTISALSVGQCLLQSGMLHLPSYRLIIKSDICTINYGGLNNNY